MNSTPIDGYLLALFSFVILMMLWGLAFSLSNKYKEHVKSKGVLIVLAIMLIGFIGYQFRNWFPVDVSYEMYAKGIFDTYNSETRPVEQEAVIDIEEGELPILTRWNNKRKIDVDIYRLEFSLIDLNNDSKLTYQELLTALKQLDVNRNNIVDTSEVISLAHNINHPMIQVEEVRFYQKDYWSGSPFYLKNYNGNGFKGGKKVTR